MTGGTKRPMIWKRIAPLALSFLCAGFAPAFGQDLSELEEKAIRAAVQKIASCVVRIDTVGGLEQVGEVLLGDGPTTGLVVSADGFILSSTFNFLRLPSSILVTVADGQRLPARIVARDQSRKLVLLKVEAREPLPVPEYVTSSETAIGQTAIAVGRTFNNDRPNISVGIISARDRIWGKAIQTDAKISPSNYGGPLVDLRGHVFGILAPLSPTSQHEMAGAEWYDGGIGFAVPLADMQPRLEKLKRGEDLHPGLLGVTLKSGDIYSLPAEIAACPPKSPAHRAGIKAGDTIVDINGTPIARQAQLRHALGPLYAGEQVKIVVTRGEQRHHVIAELVQAVEPYEHPFLGILPKRDQPAGQRGVVVRYVYADSAAASAGIRVGDRLLKIADQDIAQATALRDALAALEPGQEVAVVLERDAQQQTLKAKLSVLPAAFPPAEAATSAPLSDDLKIGETISIKIPEEQNQCMAYVPSSYKAEVPAGLLVLLPQPGELKAEQLTKTWGTLAQRYRLIIVAPQSRLANMWIPTESAFVRKVIDHCLSTYKVDRARIAVYGAQASGAMAYLSAFRLRDVVRGVVAVDAAIPLLLSRPPDNDPIERLAILQIASANSDSKTRIQENVESLRALKYPVIYKESASHDAELDESEREEIARWLETLDRI
jgi:S1-C subfamily serine protease